MDAAAWSDRRWSGATGGCAEVHDGETGRGDVGADSMKRSERRSWKITAAGRTVVVNARTAGHAARLAFRKLIDKRTPFEKTVKRKKRDPGRPLNKQPKTLEGWFEGVTCELLPRTP